jgi:hypothetical protein
VTELASTMTPREIAIQAAEAIRALNHLVADGGELTSPGEVRDIIASLELMGHGLPQLCEHLARFLVAHNEDGQVAHDAGHDPGHSVTEVIETLTAAGQAADMMTAALDEAHRASAELRSAR